MKRRLQRLVQCSAAVLALSGALLVAAAPGRADLAFPIWIDFRPNLVVSSTLSEPYFDPGAGHTQRLLTFSVANNGILPSPATTTMVTLEAGDPFSPISTAIANFPFPTPALPGGSAPFVRTMVVPDAVYVRVDVRADYYNVVNERTEHDNHRVHAVGYTP